MCALARRGYLPPGMYLTKSVVSVVTLRRLNSRPHAIHRKIPLPQKHARLHLHLKVLQRRTLRFGEPTDIGLRLLDVLDGLLGDGRDGFLYLLVRQLEGGRTPRVELVRVLPHGGVAVGADVLDDLADDGGDGGGGILFA